MTCTWIDQLGKGIDIGTDQLFQSTMFQDVCHDFVFVLELLQHFLGSDILTSLGLLGFLDYLQFVEQDLTNLFG